MSADEEPKYDPQDTADAAVEYLSKAITAAQEASQGIPWDQLDPTVGILALAKSVAQGHPELFQHPSPELLPSEKLRQVMEELRHSEQKAYHRGRNHGAQRRTDDIIAWLQSDEVGMTAAAAAVIGKFGAR